MTILAICETFTPQRARESLSTSPGNRKIKWIKVDRYAEDMYKGRWKIGNDALIFDTQGKLRNGHHRLHAVVVSGKTTDFLVRRNVSEQELISIDTGAVRTLEDATAFNSKLVPVDTMESSIANCILNKGQNTRYGWSNDQKYDIINKYKDEINYVRSVIFKNRKEKRITTAAIFAVFVRALICGCDKEKLQRAGSIMLDGGDGTLGDATKTMNCLRDCLLRGDAKRTEDVFAKVQNMLHLYLNGTIRHNVTGGMKKIYFPIEEDKNQINNKNKELEFALASISQKLKDGEIIPLRDLAKQIIESGLHKSAAKDPIDALSKAIGKLFSSKPNNVFDGSGYRFTPFNCESKRIRNYCFQKNDNNEYLKNIRSLG